MKSSEWLSQATLKLKQSGIGTARLDALVLLEEAASLDRAHLLAHPETTLQGQTLQRLNGWVERRIGHEPLAYIRGKTEFYGRKFIINKDVLEPRPESETMIELLKSTYSKSQNYHLLEDGPLTDQQMVNLILDVGTGSGALAVTAKLEIPELEVMATDIDPQCLVVARQNAKKHKANIKFLQGNLLEKLTADSLQLTAILANLPYVPDTYTINQAAAMEPRLAIYGGSDGLDLYRQLFNQLNRGKHRVQYIFTESLPMQHKQLTNIANDAGYKVQETDDFIQLFKRV